MQRVIFLIVLLFVITSGASAVPQSAAPGSPVWHWFQNCANKTTMGIEITVDGKSVFKSAFPICKTANASANARDGKQKILALPFKGGRTFQGEYHTTPSETTKGDIWQAGTDSDVIILGVSFRTKTQILLNTLHIAKPDTASRSELDRGLFVRTFPVGSK